MTGLEVDDCANGDDEALMKLEVADIANKGVGGEESGYEAEFSIFREAAGASVVLFTKQLVLAS